MSRIQPTVLRCALFGCGWLILGLSSSAAERTLFEEKFSRQLSPGWTWIDEQRESWRLNGGNLELKVVPVPEGLQSGGRKHPNLLLRDPGTQGDFAVEVQLQIRPTSDREHAGVVIYFDGDNYVAINKEVRGGDLGSASAKAEIVMVAEKAAKPEVREKAYEHEEVCLRLSVVGRKVIGQFRHYDSDEWQTLGELDMPNQGACKVGLLAGGPPKDAEHWARFSQFHVTAGSRPETAKNVAASKPSQAAKDEKRPSVAPIQKKRPIAANVPLAVQAREAGQRSVPYLEKDGVAWIKERKCVTCHYVGFMVWSFRDARGRGFDIDKEKLAEWTELGLGRRQGAGRRRHGPIASRSQSGRHERKDRQAGRWSTRSHPGKTEQGWLVEPRRPTP